MHDRVHWRRWLRLHARDQGDRAGARQV